MIEHSADGFTEDQATVLAPAFDPDSGPIFLHILAASGVLAVCNHQRIAAWLHLHARLRTGGPLGFIFATCFALIVMPLTTSLLRGPIPRFNDIFLVGIVVT